MASGEYRTLKFDIGIRNIVLCCLLAGVLFRAAQVVAGEAIVNEPLAYRMDDYRAAVPHTLSGARTIDTQAAYLIWQVKNTLFLDVMPHLPKPEKLPAGTIWRNKIRRDIPGSIWLANVGYGALTPEMETYFQRSLAVLTGGDTSRDMVFYCMANCWMSWNAAKRAISWGYSNVIWYPEGADGWEAAHYPVVENLPYESK
jgi:PQQ-dependent catabolism-associated CXXCW motif protein